MRKLKRIAAYTCIVLTGAGLFFLLWLCWHAASVERERTVCKKENIEIHRGTWEYLQNKDVLQWLHIRGVIVKDKKMREINTAYVEEILESNPYVKNAEIYAGRDSVLRMEVWQRNPVLKVINAEGRIFQLDEDGKEMPVNPHYKARLRVATGNIVSAKHLQQVFMVNAYLTSDKLWNALFEQINLTAKNEIELVPKVGSQIVLLGKVEDCEDLDEKMERLRRFYQNAMNGENFKRYSKLNLKYKNQLVATRRAGC